MKVLAVFLLLAHAALAIEVSSRAEGPATQGHGTSGTPEELTIFSGWKHTIPVEPNYRVRYADVFRPDANFERQNMEEKNDVGNESVEPPFRSPMKSVFPRFFKLRQSVDGNSITSRRRREASDVPDDQDAVESIEPSFRISKPSMTPHHHHQLTKAAADTNEKKPYYPMKKPWLKYPSKYHHSKYPTKYPFKYSTKYPSKPDNGHESGEMKGETVRPIYRPMQSYWYNMNWQPNYHYVAPHWPYRPPYRANPYYMMHHYPPLLAPWWHKKDKCDKDHRGDDEAEEEEEDEDMIQQVPVLLIDDGDMQVAGMDKQDVDKMTMVAEGNEAEGEKVELSQAMEEEQEEVQSRRKRHLIGPYPQYYYVPVYLAPVPASYFHHYGGKPADATKQPVGVDDQVTQNPTVFSPVPAYPYLPHFHQPPKLHAVVEQGPKIEKEEGKDAVGGVDEIEEIVKVEEMAAEEEEEKEEEDDSLSDVQDVEQEVSTPLPDIFPIFTDVPNDEEKPGALAF